MNYSAPSVRRLIAELNVSKETAQQIRALIRGELPPENIPAVEKWLRECYHTPRFVAQVMEGLNALLGGHGVECLNGRYVSHYWQECQLTYVNMGDSYLATLAYDTEKDRFLITSWGDFVERNRRRFSDT